MEVPEFRGKACTTCGYRVDLDLFDVDLACGDLGVRGQEVSCGDTTVHHVVRPNDGKVIWLKSQGQGQGICVMRTSLFLKQILK